MPTSSLQSNSVSLASANRCQCVRPSFLIVGASRSGTTSLHSYLIQHPEIFLCPDKQELQFFHNDAHFGQGMTAYDPYFAKWNGEPAVGDVSPCYFFHGITRNKLGRYRFDLANDAPWRIAEALPDARIVITLRHPVHRAHSQYWKNRANGREKTPTFRQAIKEELSGKRSPELSELCWIYRNRYSVHISRWLSLFPREQIKVFLFEEWTRDPVAMLRELFSFIEVDPNFVPPELGVRNAGSSEKSRLVGWLSKGRLASSPVGRWLSRANRRAGYPALDRSTYDLVNHALHDDVAALEEILGRSLEIWKQGSPER